jgi:hypothetical protein
MNKRNNLEKYVRTQPPNAVTTTFGAGLFVSSSLCSLSHGYGTVFDHPDLIRNPIAT